MAANELGVENSVRLESSVSHHHVSMTVPVSRFFGTIIIFLFLIERLNNM